MKIIKKNQIIIYTFALMLITAGYLNYTNNMNKSQATMAETSQTIETQAKNESIEENKTNKEDDEKNNIKEKLYNNKIADIGDATLVSSNDIVEDFFAKSKLERDNMYSQMLESYEKILNNSNSTEEQKNSITEEIKKINNIKNSIMICENLINIKGFENSVVFVNGDSVSVIVKADDLKTEQIAQIQNIISRELNMEVENIHISTK